MPYHSTFRLIAYSPEQGCLKRYLESGFNPNDYHEDLADWLEEEEPGDWRDEDGFSDYDKLYEWVDSAPQAKIDEFETYVQEKCASGGADRPAYEHMSFSRLVRSTWLVHFTDDPLDIAESGFKYGFEGYEGLGLTTHFTDAKRKSGPGYNFAFTVGSRDARNAAAGHRGDDPKYGKHAVVFWAGGVEAYHYGDEENQVIFWGPEVQPSRIFAIWNDGDNSWYVHNAVDRVVFGMSPDDYDSQGTRKSFEEAVEWVVANHRMLSRTEEKVERIRQQTPPRRRGVPD